MPQNIAASLVLNFVDESIGSNQVANKNIKFHDVWCRVSFYPFMKKVMAERVTIGVIWEWHVSDALQSGAQELIFHVISTSQPRIVQELRVPAGSIVVKGRGVTIVDEKLIDYSRILSVGYEDSEDEGDGSLWVEV